MTADVSCFEPVMQVTMVAIDESSALRLGMKQGDENLFGLVNDGTEGKFTRSSQLGADLNYDASKPSDTTGPLENLLSAQHISYRVFTSNVPIRGAKWSRAQTD